MFSLGLLYLNIATCDEEAKNVSQLQQKSPGCVEVACKSKKEMFEQMFKKSGKKPATKNDTSSAESDVILTAALLAASSTKAGNPCPPDREEIGRNAWTLVRLHLHI